MGAKVGKKSVQDSKKNLEKRSLGNRIRDGEEVWPAI